MIDEEKEKIMKININYENDVAIYLQIVNSIKKEIKNGNLKEGDKLPSETEFAKKHYIGRNTIRQALEILEKEGLIKKIKGKGSFICSPKIYQNRSKFSKFYDDMRVLGLSPRSLILHSKKEEPDEKIKEKMKLKNNEKIFSITWIRFGSDEPLIYETVHLNYKFVEGIEKINLDNIKLYEILEDIFRIKGKKGKEWFYPCKLTSTEARNLKMKAGDIGMHVERILFNGDDIVEYTNSVVRGDRFIYTIDFYNK